MLKASCLTLEINEFRCYEAKIEECEKAGSHRESNPGHLWLEDTSGLSCQYSGGCPAVVRQSWLSGRVLAAQARGVLGLTPGDCWLFHFPLFSPHNI